MIFETFAPWVLLGALLLDALIGDPDWAWRRLPHPVVGFGAMISRFEATWNRVDLTGSQRRLRGVGATLVLLVVAAALGAALVVGLRAVLPAAVAIAVEVVVAAVFLAQRSLYEHVARVGAAFDEGGLDAARGAVAMIVGRDPNTLDEAGVVRASIETAAENFSDGVVAPAFWFLIAGLPGLMAYKAINTADSMIGHRSERYRDYGWFAARADDVANLLPARLSGVLLVAGAMTTGGDWRLAARLMWRDASLHKSPNAGWPEAAMAGALGLALAGPRVYDGKTVADPWLNAEGDRSPPPAAIDRALRVYVAACICLIGTIATVAVVSAWL
jgi:adenosylcobinamide-phosphate synthase